MKSENTYEMDNPAAAEDGIEAMELDWTTDWINQLQSLITNPDADSSSISGPDGVTEFEWLDESKPDQAVGVRVTTLFEGKSQPQVTKTWVLPFEVLDRCRKSRADLRIQV